jgi:hypothetical protein
MQRKRVAITKRISATLIQKPFSDAILQFLSQNSTSFFVVHSISNSFALSKSSRIAQVFVAGKTRGKYEQIPIVITPAYRPRAIAKNPRPPIVRDAQGFSETKNPTKTSVALRIVYVFVSDMRRWALASLNSSFA